MPTQEICITDLTRMKEGRVCIAGITRDYKTIRPTTFGGIYEIGLFRSGRPIIYPFAVVSYTLLNRGNRPAPHTEDWDYHTSSIRLVKTVDMPGRIKILSRMAVSEPEEIFGAPLLRGKGGHYLPVGAGCASLGTLKPHKVLGVMYKSHGEKRQYRLGFETPSGNAYWLGVTDLAWRYYLDDLVMRGRSLEQVQQQMTTLVKRRPVWLRLGLANPYPKYPDRCHLQINGIYTNPDYLGGRTFADFAPPVGPLVFKDGPGPAALYIV